MFLSQPPCRTAIAGFVITFQGHPDPNQPNRDGDSWSLHRQDLRVEYPQGVRLRNVFQAAVQGLLLQRIITVECEALQLPRVKSVDGDGMAEVEKDMAE